MIKLNTKKTTGSFILDPKNNPTFSVAGKPTLGPNDCLQSGTDYAVQNDNDITIQVNVGLDNSPIVDDENFKVYFQKCTYNTTTGKYDLVGDKIYPYIDPVNGKKKSGSNYQFTVNVKSSDGLEVERKYIVGVDGHDQNGQPILPANLGYGFYLVSTVSAPTLKDINPPESTLYVKKDSSLEISGITVLTEGQPKVSVIYDNGDSEEIWDTTGELTSAALVPGKTNEYQFTLTISSDIFNAKANRKPGTNEPASTEFGIEIRTANGSKSSSTYKTVYYDVDPAIVNDLTVNPEIKDGSTYVLNGTETFKALLEDEFTAVKQWHYEILQDTNNNNENDIVYSSTPVKSSKVEFSYNTSVDTTNTTALKDKKAAIVKIVVEDKAGNIKDFPIPCYVDQSTDKPSMEAQDGVSWYKDIRNPYYIKTKAMNVISGSIYSRITDDDSVKFVKFQVQSITAKPDNAFTDSQKEDRGYDEGYTIDSQTEQDKLSSEVRERVYSKVGRESSITHAMPSNSGFYLVTQTVYDTNFVCTGTDYGNGNEPTDDDEANPDNANYFTKEKYVIKVSGIGPQYSLERDTSYISPQNTGKSLSVKISIEDGEPPYTIRRNNNIIKSNFSGTEYIDTFTVNDIITNDDLVAVRYVVSDVNGSTPKEIKYSRDSEEPEFKNPKIEPEASTYSVYKKGSDYYLNNDGQSFTISGLAEDNTSVDKVQLEIKNTKVNNIGGTGTTITKESDTGYFSGIRFANYNGNTVSSYWQGGATVTITVTDVAGNVSTPVTMNLIFDSTAPSPQHKIDDSKKDLVVRIGDYSNDAGQEDVGGKYSEGTYGNALTIQIRGLFEDNAYGSGVNKFYYKVFNNQEVIIDQNKATGDEPVIGTGDDTGKIFFKDELVLKNWIISNKTDTFSPLDENEKRNVEYNVGYNHGPFPKDKWNTYVTLASSSILFGGTPVDPMSSGKYKVNSKGYVQFRLNDVESNFKTSIKGFKEGKNYLVLVAEDNVGNTKLDSATVDGVVYPCYSLNVDIKAPTIPAKENDSIYTNIASNGTGQVNISGRISDKPTALHGSSGIKNIVFTSDANNNEIKISIYADDDETALAEKGLVMIPTAEDPTLMSWTVDIKSLLPSTNGSAIISAKVTDNAGFETSLPVANVTVDVSAPIISINNPIAATSYSNVAISFAGTANDGSGAGIDTTEGLTLYYTKSASLKNSKPTASTIGSDVSTKWVAYTTKPTLNGQNWTCAFDASAIAGNNTNTTLYFSVGARDKACTRDNPGTGNLGYVTPITVIVDRAKPVLASGTIAGKAMNNVSDLWFNSSSLNIKGTFTDVGGSGAKTVKYQIKAKNAEIQDEVSNPLNNGSYDLNAIGFENGENTLWIWALDDVANVSDKGQGYTINVDSQAPIFEQHEDADYAFSKVSLTNGSSPKTLKFYVIENESGIKSDDFSAFNISVGNRTITPVTGTGNSSIGSPDSNGKRLITLVIGTSDLSYVNGYQTVLVTVSDKAGNVSTPQSIGILNKDGDAPVPSFTSPDQDGTTVNKTITVSGKVTDSNEITQITLTASCGGTTKTYSYTKGAAAADNTISYANSIWSADINTTQLNNAFSTNGTTATLSIIATDEAGNTSSAVTRTISINQNTDRPVITIGSGVDFTQKNNNEIWVKGSSTIYGSVTDDDGISSFKIYKKASGDSTFSNANASYSGGSWNVKLPGDDSYVLKFEVVDRPSVGDGATFTSESITASSTDAQILATPVIKDAPDSGTEHQFGDTKANGNTLIPICLDTTPPSLIIKAISLDKTTWYEDYNKSDLYLGGDNDVYYIKATASDSSGLYGTTATSGISASFSGSFKETVEGVETEYVITSSAADFEIEKVSDTDDFIIKITNFDEATKKNGSGTKPFSGTLVLTLSAKDKAGMETEKALSKTIDNTAPVIRISAPDSVSSTAVVSGSIEGEVVQPKVYYAVTKTTAQPEKNDTVWKRDTFASLSYNIYFDGITSDTATHTDLFRQYLVTTGVTTSEAINNNTFTDLTPLYVWIKAEDICGNISYDMATVEVDPQGNRPNVTVSYPDTNGVKLGGTIRLMGTANDNKEAKFVWIKIDTNGDGAWTTADYTKLSGATNSDYTFGQISTNKKLGTGEDEVNITPANNNINDIAIMVRVSGGSWNQNVNADGELIPSGATSNNVTMWVSATDDDNGNGSLILESAQVVRTYIVDKDTPYFIQDSLKLVTTSGSEQTYKEGMSVKGEWWLTGTIVDDGSGIKKITVKESGSETDTTYINNYGAQVTTGDYQFTTTTINGNTNYNFRIKVGASSGVGEKSFRITAYENNDNNLSTYKDFLVRYDNEPPTYLSQTSEAFRISKEIKNSQGYYSLSSVAYESHEGDTGVERVAVYFTRTNGSKTYVFDPMYKGTLTAKTKLETGSGINLEDGLYWSTATASSISSDTLTLSTAPESHVHVGGLVKVKGVVYRINSINGNAITLSGEPGNTTSSTSVKFAVANVVDNTNPESKKENAVSNTAYDSTSGFGYGYCNDYVYDDGDMIMENLHKDDSKSWTWELYVNSKNISDGDVSVHYVIFDKAGNFTHDVVNGASVENNKPRLVSVQLGLDKNQNGTITGDEITSYYPEGFTEKPVLYNNAASEINISGITVKGKLTVTPEIVGGNGNLYYQWKTKKTTAWQKVQGSGKELMSGNNDYDDADFNNANDYIATGETALTTQTGTISHDIAWLIENSTDNDTDFNINYEIFDSTDGKTPFATDSTASNKVSINITGINLQVRDKTAPTVTIDDFYWNSLTDNSVYTSKEASQVKSVADLEGHIELHGDLPSATFNATAGATNAEFDTDDKVSGKIKLKGTVQDNIVLTDLYLTIDGLLSATKVATYDKTTGKWMNGDNSAEFVKVGTLAGTGYEFDIDKASNDFDLDNGHSVNWTLLWDTAMIGNVAQNNIKVQIRADDNAKNAGQTSNFSTTSTRQVDVVPYITGISTSLDGAYSSVPSVFNRSARGYYPVRREEVITISGFNLKKGDTVPTVVITNNASISEASKTSVELTVPSNANSGNVTIRVNGIDSLNNQTSKLVAYNQEANGINNDTLTDERKVWVWGSNQVVDGTSIRYPTFKVGSNGDEVFSYDVGGTDTFLYKNGTEYKVGSSYTQWYDTAVAVDGSGNLYGLALNGDCASPGSTDYGACASMYLFPMVITSTNVWAYTKSGDNYINFAEEGSFAWENTSNGSVYNPNRIQNPKLLTKDGNIYSVYYDASEKKVKFRAGSYSTTYSVDSGTKRTFNFYSSYKDGNRFSTNTNALTDKYILQNGKYYRLKYYGRNGTAYIYTIEGYYSTGNLNNQTIYKREHTYSDSIGNYSNGSNGSAKNSQTIASGTAASAYSAVAIVPNSVAKVNDTTLTSDEDVAVVCWYDSSAKALKFSYNTTPLAGGSWLTTPVVVDPDFAGWYPDMVVDGDGGIHISYYGAKNGDLKYAYLENFKDTTADVCTVDSYLSVGTRTSISVCPSKTEFTVGDTTVEKYVPHISYYMSAFTATQNSVRTAWPAMLGTNKTASNTYCDGAVNDKYTGYWEVQTLPLESFPNDYTIGIGEKNDSILLGYGTSEGLEISTLY